MATKSSFKKIIKTQQDKIYFGHPELDGILSNNLKKGTLILMEEDMPTSIHIQLLRYYIGSAIHMDQHCILYDVFNSKWHDMLPALLNEKKLKKNEEAAQEKQAQAEKGESSAKNQIAWRYDEQKIKLKQLDAMISKDIPKLDLSKTVKDEKEQLISRNINDFKDLRSLYDNICETLQNSLSDENDTKLRKIQISNLFGHFSKLKFDNFNLIKFLQALKALCRSSHVLLVLSIPQTLSLEIKNIIYFYFDIVMRIEPLFEREELEHFHGILHFLKVASTGNFQNFKIETMSWGIKASSKRKLEIDRLYLAPEREQSQQQQQNPSQQQQNSSENSQENKKQQKSGGGSHSCNVDF